MNTDQATHAEPDEYVASAELSTCRHCGWGIYRYSTVASDTGATRCAACPAERL